MGVGVGVGVGGGGGGQNDKKVNLSSAYTWLRHKNMPTSVCTIVR